MLTLNTVIENGSHRILTPRFTLEGTANPTMVFYYLYTEDANELSLEVLEEDQPVRTLVKLDLAPENRNKWIRTEIPLKDFLGCKYVQFAFNGCGNNASEFICIDNFSMLDYSEYDLSLTDFTAPTKININETGTFNVKIRNNGGKDVKEGDYTVKCHFTVVQKHGVDIYRHPDGNRPGIIGIQH